MPIEGACLRLLVFGTVLLNSINRHLKFLENRFNSNVRESDSQPDAFFYEVKCGMKTDCIFVILSIYICAKLFFIQRQNDVPPECFGRLFG